MKTRLDKLVVDRAIAPTRERAQALILAGRILVDEQKQTKPGYAVFETASLRMLGEEPRYVSRGGLKLEAALAHWQINVAGLACLDVGASTGGFTDCMLQHGAATDLIDSPITGAEGNREFLLRLLLGRPGASANVPAAPLH